MKNEDNLGDSTIYALKKEITEKTKCLQWCGTTGLTQWLKQRKITEQLWETPWQFLTALNIFTMWLGN